MALCLALSAPAAADKAWVEVKSPNFTVYGDAGERAALRTATRFEEMRAFMQQQWPWARLMPGEPVVIVALRDEKAIGPFYAEPWRRKGALHPAGFALRAPDRTFVVLRTDIDQRGAEENPYALIYHEYVHVVLARNFERLPLWLNEGLAEFWGSAIIGQREIDQGRPLSHHVWVLRDRPLLPLEEFFRVDHSSPHYNEENRATIFYAQAWALVHFLALGGEPGREGQLNRLAALLRRGVEPLDAARQALGDLAALQRQLAGYVRRVAFRYRRYPRKWSDQAEPAAVRVISHGEEVALRAALLVNVGRIDEGRALLEEAARVEPDLAVVQEGLGLLAHREGRNAEARDWLGRAVKPGRASFYAHYVLGTLALDEGSDAGLARAESELVEAARLNGQFAPAFSFLAQVKVRRGESTDDALGLVKRAIGLEPGEAFHRRIAAQVLAAANRIPEARGHAEAALRLAGDERNRAAARQILVYVAGQEKRAEARSVGRGPTSAVPAAPSSEHATEVRADAGMQGDGVGTSDALKALCEKGGAVPCWVLARSYAGGSPGTPKDPARAVALYEKACAGGEPRGCEDLAWAYERGAGVPVDRKRAAELRKKACDAGLARVCGAPVHGVR